MIENKHYDVVIVGAGPAGCASAYQLSGHGLKIALIDKEYFPRDKICGDALSADVINQFFRMDPDLLQKFEQLGAKKASHGVRFFAPNQECLDIDFKNPKHKQAAGFISKREDFDEFFFNQVKDKKDVDVFLGEIVESVQTNQESIALVTKKYQFNTSIALGADGAHSILNKQLTNNKIEKDHYCAGLRQYYENVSGFHINNHIELHFYKGVLPGYFWIFPLPNNQANIGLGMLSSAVSKEKINLKEKLEEIIKTHPNVKDRFKEARPIETIKGYGLPIGSKKRKISGNRFLLLGDAASLIDPFSGEGIGNAIRSGRIAAEHVLKAFENNQFGEGFNKNYDKEIYKKMWNELRVSRSLQLLLNYPRFFNFVIRKANKSDSVKLLLTSMLDNIELKKELLKPSFYFKLFFN